MCLLYHLTALWMHVSFQGFFQHISTFLMKEPKKEQILFLFSVKWFPGLSLYWIDLTDVRQWLN